jgi:hypothetical protein
MSIEEIPKGWERSGSKQITAGGGCDFPKFWDL